MNKVAQVVGEKSYDVLFKFNIVGDSNVGKTAFTQSFINGVFNDSTQTTINVDISITEKQILDKHIRIQMWDTTGLERFRAIRKSYYNKSDGIILMYDTTCRESFDSILYWYFEIQQQASEDVPIILVGSKTDLDDERVVSFQEGHIMASRYKIPFMETSAKIMTSINVVIDVLANIVLETKYPVRKESIKGQRPIIILSDSDMQQEQESKIDKKKCCN